MGDRGGSGGPHRGLGFIDTTFQGVALFHFAGFVSGQEVLRAVFGGTVRPRVWTNLATRATLNVVITHRTGGVHSVSNLLLGDGLQKGVFAFIGIVCPESCVAIRLQLNLDGVGVFTGIVVVGEA